VVRRVTRVFQTDGGNSCLFPGEQVIWAAIDQGAMSLCTIMVQIAPDTQLRQIGSFWSMLPSLRCRIARAS
jgi:hypothetical protein